MPSLIEDFQSLMGIPDTYAGSILLWIGLMLLFVLFAELTILIPIYLLKR